MIGTFKQQMDRELGLLGIKLSGEQLEQLFTYYEALMERNRAMNLIAVTDETGVVSEHFSDSLSLLGVLRRVIGSDDGCDGSRVYEGELLEGKPVIDVGTGAGFLGIPLKITFPGVKLTLLGSLNKKVKFLEEICDALELKNAEFVHRRTEDMGRQKKHREMYDLCAPRVVANLASLSEYCMPFVKIGGFSIPYKSGEIEDELKSAGSMVGILGGELGFVDKFILLDIDTFRSLVVVKRMKRVFKEYPRKAGVSTKEPLGQRQMWKRFT